MANSYPDLGTVKSFLAYRILTTTWLGRTVLWELRSKSKFPLVLPLSYSLKETVGVGKEAEKCAPPLPAGLTVAVRRTFPSVPRILRLRDPACTLSVSLIIKMTCAVFPVVTGKNGHDYCISSIHLPPSIKLTPPFQSFPTPETFGRFDIWDRLVGEGGQSEEMMKHQEPITVMAPERIGLAEFLIEATALETNMNIGVLLDALCTFQRVRLINDK